MAKATGLLLVLVLAAIVGSNRPVIAKDDLVRHTFRCPEPISFKVDWPDKVSSDPTFTVVSGEGRTYPAKLQYMTK